MHFSEKLSQYEEGNSGTQTSSDLQKSSNANLEAEVTRLEAEVKSAKAEVVRLEAELEVS